MKCRICGSVDDVIHVTYFGDVCLKCTRGKRDIMDFDDELFYGNKKFSSGTLLFIVVNLLLFFIFIIPFIYCLIEEKIQEIRDKRCATTI